MKSPTETPAQPPEHSSLSAETFERIDLAVKTSRYLDAWEIARAEPPLKDWQSPKERRLAATLAHKLGADRTHTYLNLRNWRSEPLHEQYVTAILGYRSEKLGPLKFIRAYTESPLPEQWSSYSKALHEIYLAYSYAAFRDFETTWARYNSAADLEPENRWIALCKPSLLQLEGRHDEAMSALHELTAKHPDYSAGWDKLAYTHWKNGDDSKALEIIESARPRFQDASLALTEFLIHSDRDDHQKVLATLDDFERLSPLLEKRGQQRCAARRMDAYRGLRQFSTALEFRDQVAKNSFHAKIAQTLEAGTDGKQRKRLDVPQQTQDHMTCAPASIAMLCAYWQRPVSQESIVDAICYDGTYDASERKWCEENNWHAVECRLDWTTLKALIDRDIPFAVATKEVQSGHLQVANGYDEFIDAIILQDPSTRHYLEHRQIPFFEAQRLSGPRALIIIPPEKTNLLDGLDLPDAELFTALYRLNDALKTGDRDSAAAQLEIAQKIAPENSITITATRALASYDGDLSKQLSAVETLEKTFPDDERLAWQKLGLLRSSGMRPEAMSLIAKYAAKATSSVCWTTELAEERSADARQWPDAKQNFETAIARNPVDSNTLRSYADLLRLNESPQRSLLLSRLAAFVSYRKEFYNRRYAEDLLANRKAEDAIQHLKKRVELFGSKSPDPHITYHQFLDEIGLHAESQDAIATLLQAHPENADALIFAARNAASIGDFQTSEQRLEKAKGRCPTGQWNRAAARLYENRLQTEKALQLWLDLHNSEPLASDVVSSIPRLLEQMRSTQDTLDWLKLQHETFPNSYTIKAEYARWLRDNDPRAAIELLQEMLQQSPHDGWTIRELCNCLRKDKQYELALETAIQATELHPHAPASWYFLGQAYEALNRRADARTAYLKGTQIDPDYEHCYEPAIDCCSNREEKLDTLKLLRAAVEKDSRTGDACSHYFSVARPFSDLAELVETLKRWTLEFTNCWILESLLIKSYRELDQEAQALEQAKKTTEKFSLYPAAFADYAGLLETDGQLDLAIEQWRKANAINRSWNRATHGLATALDKRGDTQQAIEVLEEGIKANPQAYTYHGFKANILSKRGDLEAAIESFKTAVLLEPGYTWAWERLSGFLNNAYRHSEMVDLARQITKNRPGEARSWLTLGDELSETAEAFEATSCFEKALELNPDLDRALDSICIILAKTQRVEEAIERVSLPKWQEMPGPMLKGRLAWLLHKKGEKQNAITKLEATLLDHPTYKWGWERLCDWHLEESDFKQARSAATRYIEQFPLSANALFQSAWIEYRNNKYIDCATICQKALRLVPSHSTAAFNLLRSSIHISRSDLLAEAKADIRAGLGEGIFCCYELCEAILNKDKKATENALAAIALHPSVTIGWLDLARTAVKKATVNEAWFYKRLEKTLKGKRHTPQLAHLRLHALFDSIKIAAGESFDKVTILRAFSLSAAALIAIGSRIGIPIFIGFVVYNSSRVIRRRKIMPLITEFSSNPDSFSEAMLELLDAAGTERFAEVPARQAIRLYSQAITSNPDLLGKAGYTCASTRDWESMIKLYLASERNHRWESWMAFNYTNALLYAGQLQEASKLAEWALDTLVPDHTTDGIKVQAAWIHAILGNMEKAKTLSANLKQPLPKFSGIKLAHLSLQRIIAMEDGESTPKAALEGYLTILDRSKIKSSNVEITLHDLVLKRFSKQKVGPYQRLICLAATYLQDPIWRWEKHKINRLFP